jgi:hypothetical protein
MRRLAFLCLSTLATLHADQCFTGGDACNKLRASSLIFRGKALAINSAIPQTMHFGRTRVPIREITYEISEPLFQAKRGDVVKVVTPLYTAIGDESFVNAHRLTDGSIWVAYCERFDDGLEHYLLQSIRTKRTKGSLTLNSHESEGLAWGRLTLVGPETREIFTSFGKQHNLDLLPGNYLLDGEADGFELAKRNRSIWVGPASCPYESVTFRGASKITGKVIGPGEKPMRGIPMSLSYAASPGWIRQGSAVQSNDEGEFEFTGLPPGDFILKALSVPPRFEGQFIRPPAAMEIRLNPREKREAIRFEVAAQQTVKLRFRILDSDGKPFAKKLVTVDCGWLQTEERESLNLRTDEAGWVEVRWREGKNLSMRWSFLGGLVRKVIQVEFDKDGKEHDIIID